MFRKKSNLYHSFLLLKDFWVHGELCASLRQAQDEEFTAFPKMQLHPAKLWNAKNSHESTCITCTPGILQALRQAYTCKAEATTCPSATRVLWLWAHCTLQIPQKSHFPCEQLCPHTSSASKVCRGRLGSCQGLAGVFACQHSGLQCLSASQDGHPVLSFASGSFLRKGILRNASAAFWHRQGPGPFSHPPRSKAAQETHSGSHAPVPPTRVEKSLPHRWEKNREHRPNPGHVRCRPARLPCPACRLLGDFPPSYRWCLARSQAAGSSHSLVWCQECLAADCGLLGALLGWLRLVLALFHGHSRCGGKSHLGLKSFRQLAPTQSGPFAGKPAWCFLTVPSNSGVEELPSVHQSQLTPAQHGPGVPSAMFKSGWEGRWRWSEAPRVRGAMCASSSSPCHSSFPTCCGAEAAAQLCSSSAGWLYGNLPFSRSCLPPTYPPQISLCSPHARPVKPHWELCSPVSRNSIASWGPTVPCPQHPSALLPA